MPLHLAANVGKWILAVACLVLLATSPLMAQEQNLPPGREFALGIPPGPLMGMGLGFFLLALLIWGIKQPLAWIVVSFLAIGCGVGCAGYGCVQAFLGNRMLEPLPRAQVEEIGIFIGSGVGATTAGIVLLVVAMLRHRKNSKINP